MTLYLPKFQHLLRHAPLFRLPPVGPHWSSPTSLVGFSNTFLPWGPYSGCSHCLNSLPKITISFLPLLQLGLYLNIVPSEWSSVNTLYKIIFLPSWWSFLTKFPALFSFLALITTLGYISLFTVSVSNEMINSVRAGLFSSFTGLAYSVYSINICGCDEWALYLWGFLRSVTGITWGISLIDATNPISSNPVPVPFAWDGFVYLILKWRCPCFALQVVESVVLNKSIGMWAVVTTDNYCQFSLLLSGQK